MSEITKCGQLLNQYRDQIKIYKLTNKQKEDDERAKDTVIENLINPKIFNRLLSRKINKEDILKMTTKHDFCGVWKVKIIRKVEFEYTEKKDIFVSLENQSKIAQIKVGDDVFNVKNEMISIPTIEIGEEEIKFDYLFEYPNKTFDKKFNKYLEKHKDSIISANIDKKISKWNKDYSLDQVIEKLYLNDIFEFLEENIYIQSYDDKNNNAYKITQEDLELDIALYLIPIISVSCQIKDENKSRIFHIDAITREIRPIISESSSNTELIETVGEGLGEGAAFLAPHKLLEEPLKKSVKIGVKTITKIFGK
ncbi:hypothetical protein BKK51_02880 [Rodentibacter trehalosifermentans]|uniref:Uncharacterized protein n=2 Tax=Rodentibacter trehalosifermentans TaxID=1908263 RepID=A0A1V3IW40_9PAST|nr:hypothetical protein [Rodentibacter trehalosifermentans]OOF46345.1 hypothetical protein BKK51_02880 [Rodentibacter trehalosifermentans]OOF48480.1 hypothetical protein BKK52_05825 [Rodentibacter trehalosifermentans]OOF53231.1 hypothetical protein BKK53_01895 [Rodentibacter trehalosifermentans]